MQRIFAVLFCLFLTVSTPSTAIAIGSAVDAAAMTAAARAAAALGAAEGLGVAVAGAGAAALAVGVFALAFCATSYVMGTSLCKPTDPATGGGIAGAINDPGNTGQYTWRVTSGSTVVNANTPQEACTNGAMAIYGPNNAWTAKAVPNAALNTCVLNDNPNFSLFALQRIVNPNYDPNKPNTLPPDVAGNNIASNPRAGAAIGAAAAAKARGASDKAAAAAATAAATAVGTGNPSREKAGGAIGAAAGAAAAAAEAAGASDADIAKAAADAAAAAAAQADKAAPTDKTCQFGSVSTDGKTCVQNAMSSKADVPAFCGWAPIVCDYAVKGIVAIQTMTDFFTWTRSEPTAQPAETVDVKQVQAPPFAPATYDTTYFSMNAACPANATGSFELMGSTVPLEFDYKPLCDFATGVRPFVIACAMIAAAFIVAGAGRDS